MRNKQKWDGSVVVTKNSCKWCSNSQQWNTCVHVPTWIFSSDKVWPWTKDYPTPAFSPGIDLHNTSRCHCQANWAYADSFCVKETHSPDVYSQTNCRCNTHLLPCWQLNKSLKPNKKMHSNGVPIMIAITRSCVHKVCWARREILYKLITFHLASLIRSTHR